MVYCVTALILGIVSLIIFITASIVSRYEKNFLKDKRQGKAKVIGYEQSDGSSWEGLTVQLLGIDEKHSYYCTSNERKISARFPVGSIIDVEYAPRNLMGKTSYEVHLQEQHWGESKKSAKVFRIVAGFFFVIAMILLIVGLLNLK